MKQEDVRVLFMNENAIGCLYAVLMAQKGYNVTIRTEKPESRHSAVSNLHFIKELAPQDSYTYVFITADGQERTDSLQIMKDNVSPTVVVRINALEDYHALDEYLGEGRLMPCYYAAAGKIGEDGQLDARLMPALYQPTMCSEIGGNATQRLLDLRVITEKTKIPFDYVPDMFIWQLYHRALALPLYAIYYDTESNGMNEALSAAADKIKANYAALQKHHFTIPSIRMKLCFSAPKFAIKLGLEHTIKDHFGEEFLYPRAKEERAELDALQAEFDAYLELLDENEIDARTDDYAALADELPRALPEGETAETEDTEESKENS